MNAVALNGLCKIYPGGKKAVDFIHIQLAIRDRRYEYRASHPGC